MPSFVHAIDACDMDGNGSNDILASCAYNDSIVILFNDGYGNFDLQYYNRITNVLICGCFDGDNIHDIITGKEGYLYFIKSNGDRILGENVVLTDFSGAYNLYGLIDMNNDGWNDLIYDYLTYWGILKNNGDLTFTNKILGSDGGRTRPSIGYFNNDSLPDIVISYNSDSRSQVTKYLINNGNLNFSINILNDVQYLAPIVSGLNKLFPDDLSLFNTPTNEVYLFENTGNATFKLKNIHYINNSAGVYTVDRSDYNNDGFDDFSYYQCFWTGCTDSLYVELNDHNWSFEPAQQYYIGTLNWFRMMSIDLNGDNYPDFYMTGYNDNHTVKILWNNGDGIFSYLNPVKIKENIIGPIQINIFPNPTSGTFAIDYTLNRKGLISLSILSASGQTLAEIQKGITDKGEYQEHISDLELPVGIYFVVLSLDDVVSDARKLIITK